MKDQTSRRLFCLQKAMNSKAKSSQDVGTYEVTKPALLLLHHKKTASAFTVGESYVETGGDWISCQLCAQWPHDLCAGVETDDNNFICALCV